MEIFEWNENIPVTANNLNEMQNTINGNIYDIYSTTEIKTNKKWLGEDVYRKVINVGTIETTASQVSTNIQNLKEVINLYGKTRWNNFTIPINFYNGAEGKGVYAFYSEQIAKIELKCDFGTGTNTYVVIEYTKNES